jgi:ribosomal protein L16 Arg81 hydroxylase
MQDFEESESAKELITHIVQYPGQIFYVPANWYHQVLNLDNSLSINHNWVDSSGLNISWQYLTQEHMIAERMIEDIRDLVSDDEFTALVNRNVLLNCGMNKQVFLTMVDFILQHMSSPRRATFSQLFKQGLHPV